MGPQDVGRFRCLIVWLWNGWVEGWTDEPWAWAAERGFKDKPDACHEMVGAPWCSRWTNLRGDMLFITMPSGTLD